MDLKEKFRHIPNFPKEGIDFIDITTVLNDAEAFKFAVDEMSKLVLKACPDVNVIVGTESRGFIFGAAIAYKLGVRFVPVRKVGKLPYATIKGTYELEYGTDSMEMHVDAVTLGDNVVIVDDLLATGGTVSCVVDMVNQLRGKICGSVFLVELDELQGKKLIESKNVSVYSVVNI